MHFVTFATLLASPMAMAASGARFGGDAHTQQLAARDAAFMNMEAMQGYASSAYKGVAGQMQRFSSKAPQKAAQQQQAQGGRSLYKSPTITTQTDKGSYKKTGPGLSYYKD